MVESLLARSAVEGALVEWFGEQRAVRDGEIRTR